MANGRDRNLCRLVVAVAAYMDRFDAYPTRAAFNSLILWDLANLLDSEDFQRLARLLNVSSIPADGSIELIGEAGSVDYSRDVSDDDHDSPRLREAKEWLGVRDRLEKHGEED